MEWSLMRVNETKKSVVKTKGKIKHKMCKDEIIFDSQPIFIQSILTLPHKTNPKKWMKEKNCWLTVPQIKMHDNFKGVHSG
jgi:hypothetical protein